MTRKKIVDIKNISFSYDKREFLKDINFSIYNDDFLGIIGPNGGGKTTLLKLILGLLIPQKGKITVFGKDPIKGRNNIGYLSQFKNIDFEYPITAYQIVMLSRINKNLFKRPDKKDKYLVKNAMSELKIWEIRNKNLSMLSGGQKQRVFVARALSNDPKLLILDEPMANLDIHIKEEFYELLKTLNKKIAIMVVDHDLDMLSRYAKEIVCVNKCKTHAVRYHETGTLKLKEVCHA